MYKLLPTQDNGKLFFRLEEADVERHGVIGYLRADFGRDGRGFWTTWFDSQPHLKTPCFKNEFDEIINSLRNDGEKPPFSSRAALDAYCSENPGADVSRRGHGYAVRTQNYSYYFRCRPCTADYEIYCFVYDNRFLLTELAERHS